MTITIGITFLISNYKNKSKNIFWRANKQLRRFQNQVALTSLNKISFFERFTLLFWYNIVNFFTFNKDVWKVSNVHLV